MKILVTTGTTGFDSLVIRADLDISPSRHEVFIQIADGTYRPKNFAYERFLEDIEGHYVESDLVITHAGAGTVFRLLELGKKAIVVPNTERVDKHQVELARFVGENNYACVCRDLAGLGSLVEEAPGFTFDRFEKKRSTAHAAINRLIEELY